MKRYLFAVAAALAVLVTSCVKDETYPYASISKVSNTDPIAATDVTVTATISALVDASVNLIYSINSGTPVTVAMTGSDGTYTGTIPAQAADTEVTYHVEATTSAGTTSSKPVTYKVAAKPAEPKVLFINEINCETKQFEIYNASSKNMNIAGYTFTKDGKDAWSVPEGMGNIPAKGFVVFTAKKSDPNEGPAFGLSGDKGFILCMYKNADVSDDNLVDMIDNSKGTDNFKVVEKGWTLSRKSDGADEWVLVEGGTMGFSNGAEPVDDGKIVINEVACGTKHFEIYNGTRKDVDISGYTFTKDGKDAWSIPDGKGNIPAKGFLVFKAKNDEPKEGPAFGLSGDKGFILCMYKNADTSEENLVDMIDNSKGSDNFKVVGDSETLGRKTDGADEWVLFSEGTIGASNNTGTIKQ